MRIVFVFSILILPLCLLSHQALSANEVARGFIWGVSSQDVLQYEKAPFIKHEGNSLFYADELYERESTIGYAFNNDKLSRIRIDIHQHFTTPQDWITLLMKVKEDLIKEWGQPLSEEFIWHNTYEKNYPENWGVAVMTGGLDIKIQWADEKTLVTTTLASADKLRPAISIAYEKKGDMRRPVEKENQLEPMLLP